MWDILEPFKITTVLPNLNFIYSEKATKLCEISTVDLTVTTKDKSKVKISQNFVAFSEYMNFTKKEEIKVSKSQKYFFLKFHCPKTEWNIRQNSALCSYIA